MKVPYNDHLSQVWSKTVVSIDFKHMNKLRKLKWNMRAEKAQISMRGDQICQGLHPHSLTILAFQIQ